MTVTFYGLELKELASLTALGVEDTTAYRRDLRRRQIEFVTALTNSSESTLAYEIRIISQPDSLTPGCGTVRLYLLGRIDDGSSFAPKSQLHFLQQLVRASFPEYDFRELDGPALQLALAPFTATHAARITRRIAEENLSSLAAPGASRRALGFHDAPRSTGGHAHGRITHIFPFIPAFESFAAFYRLILLEPARISASIRIRPTSLTTEEVAYLEGTIANCERYLARGVSSTDDENLPALEPTLREKASAHQRLAMTLLMGLRDNAAHLCLTLCSDAPVSPFVAEGLAALITQPAGGVNPAEMDFRAYLAGGYEIQELDVEHIRSNLAEMDCPDTAIPGFNEGAERLPHLFDSVEATAAFRLPPPFGPPLEGIVTRHWKQPPPPKSLAKDGVLIGRTIEEGAGRLVRIADDDRLRHFYAVGQTGTGKTTMIQTMVLDDIRAGRGICVLDPHGDLFRDLLGRIPPERIDDVIVIDPMDTACPVVMNVLDYDNPSQRHFIAQEVTSVITRLLRDTVGDAAGQMLGPVFFQQVRMNLLLTMSDPERRATLIDFYRIFQEADYWKSWLPLKQDDPLLERWVNNVLPRSNYTSPNNDGVSMGAYVTSKFDDFLFDPLLRNILARARSTVRFTDAMNDGKIVLVNLAKGELSEQNSRFFGMIILARIQAAAMARSRIPRGQRRPFYLYVDEFQSVATENFVTLLSEARKFGVGLVLANQFVTQLDNQKIMKSVFGNVGTLVSFRVGDRDAERLEQETAPTLRRKDFVNLPNWHAYLAPIMQNAPVAPFVVNTIREDCISDPSVAEKVVERSRRTYGLPVGAPLSSDSARAQGLDELDSLLEEFDRTNSSPTV